MDATELQEHCRRNIHLTAASNVSPCFKVCSLYERVHVPVHPNRNQRATHIYTNSRPRRTTLSFDPHVDESVTPLQFGSFGRLGGSPAVHGEKVQ